MPAHAGGQILGQRAEQQDHFGRGYARLTDGSCAWVLVLADGMGGHNGGAVAAFLAVETFLDVADSGECETYPELLREGLRAANRAIGERADGCPELAGMGCTLVAVLPEGDRFHYVSVGDSLLLRLASDGVERVNADHSMAPLIDKAVADGERGEDEARCHPQRSALRSALVGSEIALIDARTIDARPDQWTLIASDGLLALDEVRIAQIVAERGPDGPEEVVAGLLEAVEEEQLASQDNCTVIALREPAPAPAAPVRKGPSWSFLGLGAASAALACCLPTSACCGAVSCRATASAPAKSGIWIDRMSSCYFGPCRIARAEH